MYEALSNQVDVCPLRHQLHMYKLTYTNVNDEWVSSEDTAYVDLIYTISTLLVHDLSVEFQVENVK